MPSNDDYVFTRDLLDNSRCVIFLNFAMLSIRACVLTNMFHSKGSI